MTRQNAQSLINNLDELLEEERGALKKGELSKLEDILSRKENLIDQLNAIQDKEQSALDVVHGKVSRNQDLLKSAMLGIKAVSNRMQELRKVRRGLDVYDQRGRRARYATSGSTKLEKRA